jgi:hypothetical protein
MSTYSTLAVEASGLEKSFGTSRASAASTSR